MSKPHCEECARYDEFVAAVARRTETFADLRLDGMSLASYVEHETLARAFLTVWSGRHDVSGTHPIECVSFREAAWRYAVGRLRPVPHPLYPGKFVEGWTLARHLGWLEYEWRRNAR